MNMPGHVELVDRFIPTIRGGENKNKTLDERSHII